MYPLIRLVDVMLRSRWRSPLTPGDTGVLNMIVWPWDCDVFGEVNNGRYLTLFDLGRFDFGSRAGLMQVLKKERWGLVVAGSTIRYRRRLTPFQRYSQHTHLIARDEKWFYFVQSMIHKGNVCSSALIRTGVTSKGKVVPSQGVAIALGYPDWFGDIPDWVQAWIDADAQRPWPPKETTP